MHLCPSRYNYVKPNIIKKIQTCMYVPIWFAFVFDVTGGMRALVIELRLLPRVIRIRIKLSNWILQLCSISRNTRNAINQHKMIWMWWHYCRLLNKIFLVSKIKKFHLHARVQALIQVTLFINKKQMYVTVAWDTRYIFIFYLTCLW